MINFKQNLILGIDTSTNICSVSLFSKEKIVFNKEEKGVHNHAALIAVYVCEALEFLEKNNFSLLAVAINEGPGSYTGLRIGSSFAKGFCFGKKLPLLALSGLKCLAKSYLDSLPKSSLSNNTYLCPMMDAGRMEVYCALYDSSFNEILCPDARMIDTESFLEYRTKEMPLHCFGNGALKCETILENVVCSPFDFLSSNLKDLAFRAYESGDYADLAYWEPNYIKAYQAIKSKNKVLNK